MNRHPLIERLAAVTGGRDVRPDSVEAFENEAGDAVLVEVAQRLGAAVRDGDLVARFAGDEFVIVSRPEGAGHIADRLLRRLVDPITLRDGSAVHVGTSIGIADALDPTVDPVTADELLQRADAAMYTAKRNGKGQAVRASR